MTEPNRKEVRAELDHVIDPCSEARGTPLSIIEMGLLDEIVINGTSVTVRMYITSPVCTMVSHFIDEVEDRVGSLNGVESVTLETDSGFQWRPSMMSEAAQTRREERKQYLAELAATDDASNARDVQQRAPVENVSSGGYTDS